MSHPLLREFIQPVPVIAVTETLGTLLTLLTEHGYEQAIAQYPPPLPARLLRLSGLTAHLLAPVVASSLVTPPVLNLQATLEATLQELTDANTCTSVLVLPPLTPLPADWELHQVWQHLHTAELQEWAVVDTDGCYLGLLDQPRLWKFLATQLSVPAPWDPILMASIPVAAPTSSPVPTSIAPAELSHASMGLPTIPIPLLITLLNQLPLPLMLQTSSGQVVTQNHTWHEQLGPLLYADKPDHPSGAIALDAISEDPSIDELYARRVEHRQTFSGTAWQGSPASAAAHSDSHPSTPSTSTSSSTPAHSLRPSANQWDVRHPRMATTLPLPTCHLDTLPEDGICVCSLDNAQQRVWQFVKVSLANVPTVGSLTEREGDTLWLFLAQDVTDQQHITQELAAKNADLTQLNRLKDEFLSCISHELKTPLTAVLGLSRLLKDQAIGSLNVRQERYAQLIYRSGRHLMMIVNNILDLTRIETEQLDLVMESVSIASACQRAYEQARQLQIPESVAEPQREVARIPDPAFKLDIQTGLKQIIADDLRLRQMLVNLLTNALKFTPPGGEIGLTVEAWDGWMAFTVWDTGIGIPADKQHLIFQKFQQLENPLTRRFEGTGLGLVLTQRLARLHGGDVTFTSVEGQGSRFTLLLPPDMAHITPTGSTTAASSREPAAEQRLVLVVESVPRFLGNLTIHLGQLGYRVAIARSGTEALEKIRSLQPAVVFLNPLLPLLSGWDVLTLLKASPETQAVPILITGTHAEKRRALSSGARGFLSLPIQPEVLKQSLETVLNPVPVPVVSLVVQPPTPSATLTVLHLQVGPTSDPEPSSALASASFNQPTAGNPPPSTRPDLATLLHAHPCRVLEVDDLEQADLLARVWQPDVILLDGLLADPVQYLTQLGRHPDLASLPLITLTTENTQAANQVANLTVFPCLASLTASTNGAHPENVDSASISALFQVMQVASGQR